MKKKRSKKENKKLFKAFIILNYQERRWHPWAMSPSHSVFLSAKGESSICHVELEE